jgi:hypothetical protein
MTYKHKCDCKTETEFHTDLKPPENSKCFKCGKEIKFKKDDNKE